MRLLRAGPIPALFGDMTLFTIGHSTRPLAEFLGLLLSHGVERLVDVRRYPASRRHPHFSGESLAAELPVRGIAYEHAPELGGRRTPRADSPNDAWRSAGFRAYADHMDDPAWQQAFDELRRGAQRRVTAIMCAEAVPWRCHRQLIADALVARDVEVRHILSPGRADLHSLNPHAVIGADARVRYPAAGRQQGDLF
ncbi:MAG TPA: DUF488 domain-containing protein [Longimicrobiales bacterium]|nr:DUF488 domain-containing protein [Longimicrobiales bacterium]